MLKRLSRVLVLFAVAFVSTALPSFADGLSGEQNFYVKLEWGVFNPDGTPSTTPVSPRDGLTMRGDVSFMDSIAELVQLVNFERREDRINLDTINNTYTGFISRIVGATDGLIFDVTANFSEETRPSLYFWVEHEGRNVTLPLADLINDEDQKLEYVIDSLSRYKLFVEILSAEEVASY